MFTFRPGRWNDSCDQQIYIITVLNNVLLKNNVISLLRKYTSGLFVLIRYGWCKIMWDFQGYGEKFDGSFGRLTLVLKNLFYESRFKIGRV